MASNVVALCAHCNAKLGVADVAENLGNDIALCATDAQYAQQYRDALAIADEEMESHGVALDAYAIARDLIEKGRVEK